MAKVKGPSEGGSGGKRGHSNMAHWGYTAEVKDAARHIRRVEDTSSIREQLDADDAPESHSDPKQKDDFLLPTHPALCHCGGVKFEVDLPEGLVDLRHCNCSMCRRRGAIVATAPLGGLRVTHGHENLATYQFNTNTAKHHFCRICGIYTHHQRRSNPAQYGFNVGCLQDFDPFKVPEVTVYDGVKHPRDHHGGGRALSKRIRVGTD